MYEIDYLLAPKLETICRLCPAITSYFQSYISFLQSTVTMFDLSMKCTLWWSSFNFGSLVYRCVLWLNDIHVSVLQHLWLCDTSYSKMSEEVNRKCCLLC